MTALGQDADRGFGELTFVRTVDRSLLHRSSLSEVFLTDSRAIDSGRYLAGAQLPSAHGYYTDSLLRVGLPDPLLLLECSRQAETYGGHAHFGVPRDTKFILRRWAVDLPGLLDAVGTPPRELALSVNTSDRRGGLGRQLRGLTYHVDLHLEGVELGRVSIEVGYLPSDTYRDLRVARRGSPPPASDELAPPAAAGRVAPHLVGRANPDNVVLTDAVFDRDRVTARVRVPVTNRSMFDHAQDHLPGMVLTESARQLGLLAGTEFWGTPPSATTLIGLDATFTDYAELDAPITLTMRREPVAGPEPDFRCQRLPGARTNLMTFEQGGMVIAEARVTMIAVDTAADPDRCPCRSELEVKSP
ncbi:AfsA-related hotdog domain-containing protein [Pseudonocardia spinosispora]|uniref:AfsA-related hotdog domain-containing protein n=1 Tax=Pseudonocardia spinosispora TaxID=103441 RepID=UPI0004181082|nr:AfsA-related hotdog domain-containing protein [Pseudonocardia spinosispora]